MLFNTSKGGAWVLCCRFYWFIRWAFTLKTRFLIFLATLARRGELLALAGYVFVKSWEDWVIFLLSRPGFVPKVSRADASIDAIV